MALFGQGVWGQYPAAPSSLGPFVLFRTYLDFFGAFSETFLRTPPTGGRAKQVPFVKLAFLTRKRCIFLSSRRPFFVDHVFVQMLQNQSIFGQDSLFTRSQKLKGKITTFTVLKWVKERNHYKNHDLATIIEKRSAKRPKMNPFWTHKCARFPNENANLTNAPISRLYGTPPPKPEGPGNSCSCWLGGRNTMLGSCAPSAWIGHAGIVNNHELLVTKPECEKKFDHPHPPILAKKMLQNMP